MSILFNVVAVVVLLGGLIFVHELGHFLVAKALRVRVERFSIGFGPRLAGFTWGETEYRVAVLPLGGYVKMTGEDPNQEPRPEDRGRGFLEQAPWRRLAIAFAGPGMNLLFPFVIYCAIGLAQNGAHAAGPVVGAVAPGSPAAQAGLRPGDRVRSVTAPGAAPVEIRYFADLPEVVGPHAGEPLTFQIERGQTERGGGERLSLTIVPAAKDDSNAVEKATRGVIGVVPTYEAALVAPAPGQPSPLEALDLVTSVEGQPVRNAHELARAVAAAGCRPVAMEVRRGFRKDRPARTLAAVPTCLPDGRSALRPADPTVSTYLAAVDPGSPAAVAGLKRGDLLTAVNGHPVRSWLDLNALSGEFKPGVEVRLALGDGREVALTPGGEPYKDEMTSEKRTRPVLGFHLEDRAGIDAAGLVAEEVELHRGLGEIARLSAVELWKVVRLTMLGLGKIVTGEISFKTVGGPIMLFSMAAEAAQAGLGSYLFIMALISVNLGLMNLLPIPVLDGGHIVTAALEGVTRRRLSLRVREVANWVGLALLVTLMIFVFHNDIIRKWG